MSYACATTPLPAKHHDLFVSALMHHLPFALPVSYASSFLYQLSVGVRRPKRARFDDSLRSDENARVWTMPPSGLKSHYLKLFSPKNLRYLGHCRGFGAKGYLAAYTQDKGRLYVIIRAFSQSVQTA